MSKKINKKKKKDKAEGRAIKETKELIEGIAEVEINPFDAMFEEGLAPEPMQAVMGRAEKEESKSDDYWKDWTPHRNEKKKLTVFKCPKTHKKKVVEDKREAV